MTTYACESENGVVTCIYGNSEDVVPHVSVALSYQGPEDAKVVVSRLTPDDASMLANALAEAATAVRPQYDLYKAEVEADGKLGD